MSLNLLAACAAGPGSDRAAEASAPAAAGVVSQAQGLLGDLGYGPVAVDGIEGPRTAEAVRAFQSATGLPADGRVSQALVERLEAEREARLVFRAQRRLAALGFDPGLADGRAGARTRAAVTAFQEAHGLVPDGEVTPGLVERLAAAGEGAGGGSAPSAAPDGRTPVLRPGDRVVLSYLGAASEPAEMKIDPDGRLALPEVGRVRAAGLDLKGLRDQVTVKLIESYLSKLDVAVRLVAEASTAGAAGDPRARVLSPGDRLSVRTAAGDATPAELEIDADGWLLMPEAGKLRAAGLGLTELRDDITVRLLESYMDNLEVKVRLAGMEGATPSAE